MKKLCMLLVVAALAIASSAVQAAAHRGKASEGQAYHFALGYPDPHDIGAIYDELDYQRAVQAYLWAIPAVASYSFVEGMKKYYHADMYTVNIWQTSANPKTVVFTGNSQSIYSVGYYDLSKTGPMVLEFPAGVLGMIDDLWYALVTDVGLAGPDRGKGGKYLILPPDYKGTAPAGYHTFRSTTNLNIWLVRGFKGKDGSSPVDALKGIRLYPLNRASNPPKMTYTLVSDIPADLTFPTDERFFDVLGRIFTHEHVRKQDMAYLGMLQSLGIVHGQPFTPDARLRKIFRRAAETGNAMARTIAFSSRNSHKLAYPDRHWEWIFLTDSPTFYTPDYLDIEARVTYTYQACFTADAMVQKLIGAGSQYLAAYQDSKGRWLDGSHTYKLTLPPGIPVVNFWSLMVYDAKTRSMIVTDTHQAGVDSYGNVKKNPDGSIDLYVGPKAPKGMESNWVKTRPGEGFFVYFRFYGPTKAFFDKSWVIGDLERLD